MNQFENKTITTQYYRKVMQMLQQIYLIRGSYPLRYLQQTKNTFTGKWTACDTNIKTFGPVLSFFPRSKMQMWKQRLETATFLQLLLRTQAYPSKGAVAMEFGDSK